MAKKKEEEIEIIEHREIVLEGVYANDFGIGQTEQEVTLNFLVTTPSMFETHGDEKIPVARIFLPWNTAKLLSEVLNVVVSDQKAKTKTKKK